MSTRRWIRRLHDYPLYRPIDIWLGGPNADGRGLDAINGGYNTVPGLQITSPTADPAPTEMPSSTASYRILKLCDDGDYRPKVAGELTWIPKRGFGTLALPALPQMVGHAHRPNSICDGLDWSPDVVGSAAAGKYLTPARKLAYASGVIGDQQFVPANVNRDDGGITVKWVAVLELSEKIGELRGEITNSGGSASFSIPFAQDFEDSIMQDITFVRGLRTIGTGPNGGIVVVAWAYLQPYKGPIGSGSVQKCAPFVDPSGTARWCVIHHLQIEYNGWEAYDFGQPRYLIVTRNAQASIAVELMDINQQFSDFTTLLLMSGPGIAVYPHLMFIDHSTNYWELYFAPPTRLATFANSQLYSSNTDVVPYPAVVGARRIGSTTDLIVNGQIDRTVQNHQGTAIGPIGFMRRRGLPALACIRPVERILIWNRSLSSAEITAAANAMLAARGQ